MNAGSTYGSFMHDELARLFGPLKHGAEMVARAARSTPRAAENWLAGLCAPSGQALFNLMVANEELEARIIARIREEREKQYGRVAEDGRSRRVAANAGGAALGGVAGGEGVAVAGAACGAPAGHPARVAASDDAADVTRGGG